MTRMNWEHHKHRSAPRKGPGPRLTKSFYDYTYETWFYGGPEALERQGRKKRRPRRLKVVATECERCNTGIATFNDGLQYAFAIDSSGNVQFAPYAKIMIQRIGGHVVSARLGRERVKASRRAELLKSHLEERGAATWVQ